MKSQSIKHFESGRTMLEMLGVLGIMGIIMYGAIAGINYGMSTYKINQTYNEIQESIQGIQDLYSWNRYDYSAISVSLACDNDIFTNCNSASTAATNPFGGGINVAGDRDTFTITYSGVDQPSCNRLKEMEWGTVVMDSACSAASDNEIKFCPKETAGQTSC